MEPNTTEKLIKETFSERAIEPSPEARERLIRRLNTKAKKRHIGGLPYLAVASLILGFWYFANNRVFQNQNTEENIPILTTKDSEPALNPLATQEDSVQNIKLKQETATINVAEVQKHMKSEIKNKSVKPNNKALKFAMTPLIQPDLNTATDRLKNKSVLVSDDSKAQDTVSYFDREKSLVPQQSLYIVAEDLLRTTDLDSSVRFIQNKWKPTPTYVNSTQLLIEMEKQLFEDKNKNIFSKTKKQLKKIKEVVADRNYKN